MNFKYLIGKSIFNLNHSILSSKVMPLLGVVPLGISYPYDIKRFFHNHQVKTVFDVGANIGQTVLFLNQYFPKADFFHLNL